MKILSFNRLLLVLLVTLVLGMPGCRSMSVNDALNTGSTLLKAGSITDEQMIQEARAAAVAIDKKAKVAPANSKYQQRINKLAKNLKSVNGVPLNIKVYMTKDINAFAMADGTIRVYSGLMDGLTDDEVLFIIGHEIGHVAEGHSKQRLQAALLTKAGRQAITSTADAKVAVLTDSQLGDFMEKVINAQFSQANEHEADDYGLMTLKQSGRNPEAAATALEKLASLSGSGSDFVAQMVSTHPEPGARAARMREAIQAK